MGEQGDTYHAHDLLRFSFRATFLLFFFTLYIFMFLSFAVNYILLPFEFSYFLSYQSWLQNLFSVASGYASLLVSVCVLFLLKVLEKIKKAVRLTLLRLGNFI